METSPHTPVDVNEDAAPKLALALVLDRSGSMTGLPIEMAKRGAMEVAKRMTGSEMLEVVVFDASPTPIIKMQAVRDPVGIAAQIERITPGGGTDFLPALDMAHESMRAAAAPRRHVIFVSDGQSPTQGIADLAREMKTEAISVTTVGLGAQCDQVLLEEIAHTTGGRFFKVSDPNDLVELFVNELSAARGT
jgi:uncharacterized protein with von Willebrand factor type A (vWA) domain